MPDLKPAKASSDAIAMLSLAAAMLGIAALIVFGPLLSFAGER
jgi:hypothetical protein